MRLLWNVQVSTILYWTLHGRISPRRRRLETWVLKRTRIKVKRGHDKCMRGLSLHQLHAGRLLDVQDFYCPCFSHWCSFFLLWRPVIVLMTFFVKNETRITEWYRDSTCIHSIKKAGWNWIICFKAWGISPWPRLGREIFAQMAWPFYGIGHSNLAPKANHHGKYMDQTLRATRVIYVHRCTCTYHQSVLAARTLEEVLHMHIHYIHT